MEQQTLVELTADIVAAHVENNQVPVGDIGSLIQQVHQALSALGEEQSPAAEAKVPVVSIRASVKQDHIVCMECGKKQKTLKRHLQSAHNMTPAEYRKDYGLPASYPMTAPSYSETRRSLAHSIGLGRKKKDEGAVGEAPASKGKKGRGRPKKEA
jgi:predicted transcriptional regulator